MSINHSFPNSDTNKRYYTYDYYLRKTFGRKCAKVPLDGGFTCPNIDGIISKGGCTFCSGRGSGDFCAQRTKTIPEQFAEIRRVAEHKWGMVGLIPYFQAFTNTYAPVNVLRQKYEEALSLPDTVGINIATRADCLPGEVLDLLEEVNQRTALTVELGLQSIHDDTLCRIHRGHDYKTFLEGYRALTKRQIPVCVHIINGLPGEGEAQMLSTAAALAELHPQSVKIHSLHILKDTALAQQYAAGEFTLLTLEEYVDITCRQLERLDQDIVIARVMGDAGAQQLIAPDWCQKKLVVLNQIDQWFVANNSMQGLRCCKEEK